MKKTTHYSANKTKNIKNK